MPRPFLAQVEQDPAAGRADDLQRLLELRPAIAFQRAEHVAGQAFAVQPDQRRLAAERADHQRDMLLRRRRTRGRRRSASSGSPSSGSLARATISTSAPVARVDVVDATTLRRGFGRRRSHSAGSRPAERASASAAARRLGAVERRPAGAARSAPRSRSRPGSASASAASASSQGARSISTGAPDRRLALVGERQRRGALAADQQRRRRSGIEQVEQLRRRGLDRDDRDGLGAVDPHRPPGAQRGDRAPDRRPCAQSSISQISGTWSDGRSQLRHGSSTSMRGELRRRARARPTYGRAGGRGRSWSSRASGSSTR